MTDRTFRWALITLWSIVLVLLGVLKVYADSTLPAMLTWHNPDVTSQVQIEKSNSATGTFTLLAQLSPGSITYTDATNAAGSKACYRLRYFNGVAQGAPTTPKCKTFSLTPTLKPTTVTAQ